MAYSAGLSYVQGTIVQDEAGATDNVLTVFGAPVTIEQFGGVCCETGSVNAAKAVYSLEFRDPSGGTVVEKATITIADSLAVGTVTYNSGLTFPLKVPAGTLIAMKHKTAATGAGGATYPFFVYRLDGYVDSKTTTPVTKPVTA